MSVVTFLTILFEESWR